VSRARAASAAALLASRVPAGAVPVPPAGWTPAAGFLVIVMIAVTTAAAVRHRPTHRNPLDRTPPEGEEA
jgi:hypothetical protein